jgi:hypothetical protein
VELLPFDEAAEIMRSLVPAELGELRSRANRYGLKVWFDVKDPPREHYEAQVMGTRFVPEATVLAIELGFHLEHRKPGDSEAVFAALLEHERAWRKALGREVVAGPFLGSQEDWRRISETWIDPDLGDPDLPIELATRLTDYVTALEPLRRRSERVPFRG